MYKIMWHVQQATNISVYIISKYVSFLLLIHFQFEMCLQEICNKHTFMEIKICYEQIKI